MDSQDAADIVLLEREEMATFLHEHGDAAASAGSDVEKCGKCGVTKAVCEMATRWKCMKCHIVHLLKYADLWWKDRG
jgi:ribosomal protein S27AE